MPVNPRYRRLVYIIAGALCVTALMVLAFGLMAGMLVFK
jgi:hypothetical protein